MAASGGSPSPRVERDHRGRRRGRPAAPKDQPGGGYRTPRNCRVRGRTTPRLPVPKTATASPCPPIRWAVGFAGDQSNRTRRHGGPRDRPGLRRNPMAPRAALPADIRPRVRAVVRRSGHRTGILPWPPPLWPVEPGPLPRHPECGSRRGYPKPVPRWRGSRPYPGRSHGIPGRFCRRRRLRACRSPEIARRHRATTILRPDGPVRVRRALAGGNPISSTRRLARPVCSFPREPWTGAGAMVWVDGPAEPPVDRLPVGWLPVT